MRSARKRGSGLPQGNQSPHCAPHQIKFRNRRRIPQRNKSPLSIACHHSGIRQRSRNALVRGKIKAMHDFSIGTIQQDGLVRTIACHQDTLFASAHSHAQPRRIGHILELIAPHFSRRQLFTRSQRQESLRSYGSILKAINCDSISRASLLFSQWICQRRHRRKQMLAIHAESQPQKVGLLRPGLQALVWKIPQLVRLQIQHR